MSGSSTSFEAIRYAVRELARRAGVPRSELTRWRVDLGDDGVVCYPSPELRASVVFPCDRSKPGRYPELAARPASRFTWMHEPPAREREWIPNFIVPFDDGARTGGPLFAVRDDGSVECRADLLTATLWILGRYEEVQPIARDEHTRVSAASVVATRDDYLERPVVDEYGAALRQVLQHLQPSWKPQVPAPRVMLSHDMDQLGIPMRFRRSLKHVVAYRNVQAFAQDACAAAGFGKPAYLDAVYRTAALSMERGIRSAFFFTAARRPSVFDRGYDLQHPKIRATIEHLQAQQFDIGLHPAYSTFDSQARLDEEVAYLRRLVGTASIGGRTHYLRWHPQTWLDWESAGLAYDSTLTYHDGMGFRCGSAVPFHPWNFAENRELQLLEIPLVVMDCTPVAYMRLPEEETLRRVAALVQRCAVTGGVFTLLWHNAQVIDPPYAGMYPALLDMLRGHTSYDWSADLGLFPLPGAIAVS